MMGLRSDPEPAWMVAMTSGNWCSRGYLVTMATVLSLAGGLALTVLGLSSSYPRWTVARFAPGSADNTLAERAARHAITYAEALRARRSWWRRAWWSIHPGPLRWGGRKQDS